MESSEGQSSTPILRSPDEEINIRLEIMKTVSLRVRKSETITNIKAIVHEKEGISENCQDLFYAGRKIANGRLIDYNIENNFTLHLIHQTCLKLFVKLPTSESETTIEVEALARHTVQHIKSLIEAETEIQSNRFTLVYDGNLLNEDLTLASLNIKSESKLQLVFFPREVLSVSVKVPTGETLKLKVKRLSTVDDVKAIVGSITGVPVIDQSMFYAGKEIEGCNTLDFHGIKEDRMLQMQPSLIQIFVKTETEEIVGLKVKALLTVHDVKVIVANMIHASIINRALFYAGVKLEDAKTLASYDIKEDYLLHFLPAPFQIFLRPGAGQQ